MPKLDSNRIATTVIGALLAAVVIYQFKMKTKGLVDNE
jgi:hypothetical protein